MLSIINMTDTDPYGERCGFRIRILITIKEDPHLWNLDESYIKLC